MAYGLKACSCHPLNKPKPMNRFSDVHAGSSLVINFYHITKRLVIVRLGHWPLGGKTIGLSLPKGLLTLKGQRIFFHLQGWRVTPAIFAMLTRSPNCILGFSVFKIILSLTSLSCWINNFGFLTFLWGGGRGGLELEWNAKVCVCECEWCQWMGICRWMHVYEFVWICIFGIWRGVGISFYFLRVFFSMAIFISAIFWCFYWCAYFSV